LQLSKRSNRSDINKSARYSIDAVVGMIETEQEDWVDDVLDNGIVGMLNVHFDNILADNSSD
jgi:hypothetical protein